MAIDFSQVKTITIPEGSVKKITDSTGNILWKKGPSWHTVWEGNQKFGYGGQESSLVLATVPYSESLKIRITFSDLSTNGGSYDKNKYVPSNKISPVTYDKFSSNITILVSAYTRNSNSFTEYTSYLRYNKTTGKIYGGGSKTGSGYGVYTYIVITKIEVFS